MAAESDTSLPGELRNLFTSREAPALLWLGRLQIWKGENMLNTQLPAASLVDRHNRRFTYLRLSVTDACNFQCNYCLPDGYCPSEQDKAKQPLSPVEIKRLVQAFAANGTRKIRITGGEPTLRRDLAEIIQICKSTPGIETVAMTSNGYNLCKNLDSYIDAGLDSLNLSADSLQPETFKLITGRDKLDHVLDSIKLAKARGLNKIKVNAVLMREYNGSEINEFLEFVRTEPVTLRLIELMQTGDNEEFYNAQHVSGQSIQQRLLDNDWLQVIRHPDAGPALEYTHPDYAGNIGLIMPYSKNFCDSCNRLRVSSTGNIHNCLFNEANGNLRPFLSAPPEEDAFKYDNAAALSSYLRQVVLGKWEGHQLEQGFSGTTKHLAMLGG